MREYKQALDSWHHQAVCSGTSAKGDIDDDESSKIEAAKHSIKSNGAHDASPDENYQESSEGTPENGRSRRRGKDVAQSIKDLGGGKQAEDTQA
jgi:hypothetical protein